MRALRPAPLLFALLLALLAPPSQAAAQRGYPGFDKNEYPGDEALPALRQSFRYAGYWLNNPPGADHNSWRGKRDLLRRQGFGFLVLYNGRLYRELASADAAELGAQDGAEALARARSEGFPRRVRIFLDMEEGGRLLPAQVQYLLAWVETVREGGARPAVYCSAIEVPDGEGLISTAAHILQLAAQQEQSAATPQAAALALWVANDQCPPAPGCAPTSLGPASGALALDPHRILVWQYAQSPRRLAFTAGCPMRASESNCYAPLLPEGPAAAIDRDTASTPDPSEGR